MEIDPPQGADEDDPMQGVFSSAAVLRGIHDVPADKAQRELVYGFEDWAADSGIPVDDAEVSAADSGIPVDAEVIAAVEILTAMDRLYNQEVAALDAEMIPDEPISRRTRSALQASGKNKDIFNLTVLELAEGYKVDDPETSAEVDATVKAVVQEAGLELLPTKVIDEPKKKQVAAAAKRALKNEEKRQKNSGNKVIVDAKNFSLDLETLDNFVAALVGRDQLNKLKNQAYNMEYKKALERQKVRYPSPSPKQNACLQWKAHKAGLDARNKLVRDTLVNYSGNGECLDIISPGKSYKDIVDDCYICGIPIDPTREGFSAECEHVFPIAQAVFFFDLFHGKKTLPKEEPARSAAIERYKKEYKWSHRVCNQVKSSTHFLIGRGTLKDRKWEVSDVLIQKQLNDLWVNTDFYKGTTNLIQKAVKNKTAWMNERTKAIHRVCQIILDDFTGQCKRTATDEFIVARLTTCRDEFLETAADLTVFSSEEPPPIKSLDKAACKEILGVELSSGSDTESTRIPAKKAVKKASPAFKANLKTTARKRSGRGRRTRRTRKITS